MYPLAHQDSRARLLVEAMLAEHELIVGLVERLRSAPGRLEAAGEARALSVTFESHLAKENDQILPLLAESPGVSLADALEGMHELLGGHGHVDQHDRDHDHTHAPGHTHAHDHTRAPDRPHQTTRPSRRPRPTRPSRASLVRVRGRVRLRRERRSRPARARRPVGAARHPARHHLRRPGCGELRRRSRPGRTARPPPAAEAARGTRSGAFAVEYLERGRRPGGCASSVPDPHCRGCRALPDGAHGAVDNRTDG